MQNSFWNRHYKTFTVQAPSDFACYCARRYLDKRDLLVELGCGNGRDGGMLSRHVQRYIGIDICDLAIQAFREAAARPDTGGPANVDLLTADFTRLDFNKLGIGMARMALFNRFSLHSITYEEHKRLVENIANISVSPWIWMIEARTVHDSLYGVGRKVGLHEFETDHYRRFIDPAVFLRQIAERFAIKYFEVSDGFAMYGKENPVVMRAVIEGGPQIGPVVLRGA